MANQPDELLWRDKAGDSLWAAPPRGQHGTLLMIRPGEGTLYVPTAAVDALRTALANLAPASPSSLPRPDVSTDPAHYLTEAELAEGRELHTQLCARIRSNVSGRIRRTGAGIVMIHLEEVRRQVTASRRIATAADADVGELHREWRTIARLAEQETTAKPEVTYRLTCLAGQMVAAYDGACKRAR